MGIEDTFDYLIGEGIDFFDSISSDLPSAGSAELIDDAWRVISRGVSQKIKPNIFSNYGTMRAVVLYPFMMNSARNGQFSPTAAGYHGSGSATTDPATGQIIGGNEYVACFARCPTLHSTLTNPFTLTTKQEKFAAIKDHPIFVSEIEVGEGQKAIDFIIPGTIIEVDFEDRINFKGGILKEVLAFKPSALPDWAQNIPGARQAFALGTSAMLAFGGDDGAGSQGPALGTGTPAGSSPNAAAFIAKMKTSPHLKDFSDVLLAGLAANAQKESAFCPENAGDARGDIATGNAKYAIKSKNCSGRERDHCSFGYWQMNVCADGAGGQRFAEHFKIDLMDKEILHAAITDPEKQFEVIAKEMISLFGDDVYKESWDGWTATESAEWWGQQIAEKYERCRHCKHGDTSWVERGNVAGDIINKGYTSIQPPSSS